MNSKDTNVFRAKNEKERQPYNPAIWFLGLYQINKHEYTEKPVAPSFVMQKQKPKTF